MPLLWGSTTVSAYQTLSNFSLFFKPSANYYLVCKVSSPIRVIALHCAVIYVVLLHERLVSSHLIAGMLRDGLLLSKHSRAYMPCFAGVAAVGFALTSAKCQ